jgi:hypothetical protein
MIILIKRNKLNRVFVIFIIFCLFVSIITFSGCSTQLMDTSSKITAPEIKSVPFQGRWEIEKSLFFDDTLQIEEPANQWVGTIVELGKSSLFIGEDYWNDINYRIRRVSAEEYFLHRAKGSLEKLGLESGEIFVVSISSQGKFLYEFLDINKDEAIINIEDRYFYMKKLSEQVSDNHKEQNGEKLSSRADRTYEQRENGTSGILLGLRKPVKLNNTNMDTIENSFQKFVYRTLWISSKDFKLQPVLEGEDIFLPRISGFWKVGAKERTENGKKEEYLYAYSITEDESKRVIKPEKWNYFWSDREGVLKRTILYAGNDYISIELSGKGFVKENINSNIIDNDIRESVISDTDINDKEWEINMLQTLPVDNIESHRGIKLSDISGENGALAMKSAIEKLISSSGSENFSHIDDKNLEENFALFRKTGHWFFKGRVGFETNSIISYQDYYINLIPPLKMVAYDDLHIPWTYIKDRIPQTVDAYTSPDNDMAIVLTRDSLLIYTITEGKLSNIPSGKIKLDTGDTVVMAEWATGDYVEKWENTFAKYNEMKIVETEEIELN